MQNEIEALQHFTDRKCNHINHLLKHFEDAEHHYLLLEAE